MAARDETAPERPYSREYFDELEAGVAASAGALLPVVVDLVAPRSAIDVGCGSGAWLRALAALGVADLVGVDGEWARDAGAARGEHAFVAADLGAPLALDRRFDLALSLEVAEHLAPERADDFVASLTALAPVVLFSAAVPGQGGAGHVNEQWPGYWAARFSAHGHDVVDSLRPRIWEDARIEYWYRQNALLFVERELLASAAAWRAERERARTGPLAIAHPELVGSYVDLLAAPAPSWPRRLANRLRPA